MSTDEDSTSTRSEHARPRRRALRVPVDTAPEAVPDDDSAEEIQAEPSPSSRTKRPSEPTKPLKQRRTKPKDSPPPATTKMTAKPDFVSGKPDIVSEAEASSSAMGTSGASLKDEEKSADETSLEQAASAAIDWDEVSRPSGSELDENTLPDDPPKEAPEASSVQGEEAEAAEEETTEPSTPSSAMDAGRESGVVTSGLVAVGEAATELLRAPKQRQHISEPPPPFEASEAERSSDTHQDLSTPEAPSDQPDSSESAGSDEGDSDPSEISDDGERLSLPEIFDIADTENRPVPIASAPPPPPKEPTPPAAPRSEAPVTEPVERRGWYEDLFDRNYQRTVRPRTPKQVARECDFILARLELEPGARILDLGCGEGMHVAEIACRGYDVVGVDLSPEMIRQARGEAEDRECDVELIERDMRELEFDGEFDAVLCWNAVFGYFSDEENRRAVRQMHRALKPGGRLLLDVVNRDYAIGQHPNFVWFEGDDCVCMEETGFNFIASRLQVSRTIILQNSQQLSQKYTLRLYSLHELGQLLHHQGFRVAEVSGQESAPGAFFGDVSPRMIVLAERRVASGEA